MTSALRKPAVDQEALLTGATIKAAELLGITNADLAKTIGVSVPTVSRYKRAVASIAPSSKPGELALMLIRVFRSLDPLVGSDGEMRKAWIHSRNEALNGVPAKLILRPDGLARTLAYLDGMRAAA